MMATWRRPSLAVERGGIMAWCYALLVLAAAVLLATVVPFVGGRLIADRGVPALGRLLWCLAWPAGWVFVGYRLYGWGECSPDAEFCLGLNVVFLWIGYGGAFVSFLCGFAGIREGK